MSQVLDRSFFNRNTLDVAQELLGKKVFFNNYVGIITETEAYIGTDDPACHAARGKTKRTEVMFGPAGISYVYLIYGMYHCLNFVTEEPEFPAAVLIRGLYLEEQNINLDGPGKLCKYLGITKEHNNLDITIKENNFYLINAPKISNFTTTSRIGISKGQDKLWRFISINMS